MTDFKNVKLGRIAKSPFDERHLMLARYVDLRLLPDIPDHIDFDKYVDMKNFGMDANDKLGDCTCAGIDHLFKVDCNVSGKAFTSTEQDVIKLYENSCGYDPANPNTDEGGYLIDVLKYVAKHGFVGHNIGPYVKVQHTDIKMVRAALYLFGALYCGVALPKTARDQNVWTVSDKSLRGDAAPGSWGGHCVVIGASPYRSIFKLGTWGTWQYADASFIGTYFDEVWAVLTQDWLKTETHKTIVGFDIDTLMKDLNIVRG